MNYKIVRPEYYFRLLEESKDTLLVNYGTVNPESYLRLLEESNDTCSQIMGSQSQNRTFACSTPTYDQAFERNTLPLPWFWAR